MSDEHDAGLDEARDREPELVVDDVLEGTLGILELALVNGTKDKVKENQANKTILKKKFKSQNNNNK